jgi:hypothetical protein
VVGIPRMQDVFGRTASGSLLISSHFLGRQLKFYGFTMMPHLIFLKHERNVVTFQTNKFATAAIHSSWNSFGPFDEGPQSSSISSMFGSTNKESKKRHTITIIQPQSTNNADSITLGRIISATRSRSKRAGP